VQSKVDGQSVAPVASPVQASGPADAIPLGIGMSPEHILALQRTAGNQAVLRALAATPGRGALPDKPLPFHVGIQRSFGHHDLSNVTARMDSGAAAEARALGAEAFTRGAEVAFARAPDLHTAAHEAAHVIQQRGAVELPGAIGQEGDTYERHADAVADRVVSGQSSQELLDSAPGASSEPSKAGVGPARSVIQLRRIPPNVRALLTAGGGPGSNFAANAAGTERLIELAMGELSAADQATVLTSRRGGLTVAAFNALPQEERLSRHAEAIASLFPDFVLGDPALIDTGPRPLTADAANITTVVNNTDAIFAAIAGGAQDPHLRQVFGARFVATAKAKYARGRSWMNRLHGLNRIVTDRSGYPAEVGLGGLTGFHEIIRLEPSVIDSPGNHDSVITLLHESVHAGNDEVSDDVYITAAGFTTQTASQKLRNAAHFEVVPWRILDPANDNAFPIVPATVPPTFQTFIPAGRTVGGVTAPRRTASESGAIAAYNLAREAWTVGLNLHLFYVRLFKTPTDWNVRQRDFGGHRFRTGLPFWSKVQKLTIHLKTTIDPRSADEARRPVSQIDIALSEGLVRKLDVLMGLLEPLSNHAAITAFESANSTPAEQAAAFPGGARTRARQRDFLLQLAVRHPSVTPLTGTQARDLRVVRTLGRLDWGTVLNTRSLSSFPA
jgi:hypothetical protein